MSDALQDIVERSSKAHLKYGDYASTHEAYGVLAEEVSELLDAIRLNDGEAIRDEAIDVAAVAYRLAVVLDRNISRFRGRSALNA